MLNPKILGFFSLIIYLLVLTNEFGLGLESKISLKGNGKEEPRTASSDESTSSNLREKRAAAAPAAAEDDNVDPFPKSFIWADFVRRMDEIVILIKTRAEALTKLLSPSNPDFSSNKAGYLESFLKGFPKDFKPITDIFEPLQEQLDFNKAYTVYDPAVGLETLDACKALAKSNPTTEVDKGRLKWIEINAMAATLHHIFNRLTPIFEEFDLAEINETLTIQYPSWTATSIQNEGGNTYVDMMVEEMNNYINTEIDSLGPNFHLIRLLEKLLQKKYGLVGWDPAKTHQNKYCYGNNKNGLIHDKMDVLIDAAEYLVMADMKVAFLKIISLLYKTYKIEAGESHEEKPDLAAQWAEIHKNMIAQIDKKIKFSPLAEKQSEVAVTAGPIVFRCDPSPTGCDGVTTPRVTAPNCPKGVYVQDWVPYHKDKPLTVPEDLNEPIKLEDGTPVACLAPEIVAFSPNGSIVPCQIVDKVCVDLEGKPLPADPPITVKVVPILIDETRVPIHRDILTHEFPVPSQWGIFDCSTHIPHPTDSPFGPPGAESMSDEDVLSEERERRGPNCTKSAEDNGPGFLDCRPPGLNPSNTAEFTLAFPGYLESEMVLSPEGKCVGSCLEYKLPSQTCINKTTHCDLFRDSHCEKPGSFCMSKQSKCPNKARRCIRTAREIQFCPAQPGTGKLYDWYAMSGQPVVVVSGLKSGFNNETVDLAANPVCRNGNASAKVLERWEMEDGAIIYTPQYCEICFCVCADATTEEGRHSFDIEALNADTANGYIVSGLRFEHKNNIMILNIQQGKVLPNGKIDSSTLQWLEPSSVPGRTPKLVELGSKGFLRINLDVIEPEAPGQVVTGVQWRVEGKSLVLSAGFSAYDEIKGTIGAGPPTYLDAKFPPPPPQRTPYDLQDPISPMKQSGPSQPYPISDNSKYIEFDASSLLKDGGQAVVPFFDLQPLLGESASGTFQRPLKNVGILYKSKTGSGGFITISAKF